MPYAWLLVTYPKDYRRRHGAELLEPMIAESRRPTVREGADLIVHGLRTRLGRPTSRTVVAVAMLTTAVAALYGASAGATATVPGPEQTDLDQLDNLLFGAGGVQHRVVADPFTAGIGGLAAAVVAFLVFGWASRRTGRPGHPARVAVVIPFGLAMVFWWAPMLLGIRAGGLPAWSWFGRPTISVLLVAGAVFAGVALMLAAVYADGSQCSRWSKIRRSPENLSDSSGSRP